MQNNLCGQRGSLQSVRLLRFPNEGLVVTTNYSNGTSEDVTSKCSITPAEGKTFDAETDTYAEITYSQGDNEANCMLTLA